MFLFKMGGSLDVKNDNNFTPVGYAEPALIKFLNMEKCVTFSMKSSMSIRNDPPNNEIMKSRTRHTKLLSSSASVFLKPKKDKMDEHDTSIREDDEPRKNVIRAFLPAKIL